jgi:tripartite ATP-independent transporter DctP family solute receptor
LKSIILKKSILVSLSLIMLLVLSVGNVLASEYTIKMATPSTPADSNVKAFYYFEKLVESRSGGRIDVQVFDRGQLGSARDYIEGMQMGSIQMAEITTSVLSAIDDQFMVIDLPYIATSMDHLRRVLETSVGERLSEALEEKAGIKILGYMIRTPRAIYSSKGPINTAADFSGLKVRVMESPVMIRTFELLGAKPTPIAATERYMALQTGVVDAAENSPPLIITEKEYEVTQYVSLTEHFTTANVIAIDAKFLNKLPEDLKQVVIDSSRDAAHYARGVEEEQLSTTVEKLRELGMEVNFIEDKSSFVDAVRPIYEEYEDKIGVDLINVFLETE